MMTNFSKKGKHFFEKIAKNQRFFKVFCNFQSFFADVANIALPQKKMRFVNISFTLYEYFANNHIL